jgi:DNA repair photolyase
MNKMSEVSFYKQKKDPNSLWINNEYLVQLNITGNCPLSCSFCYIKEKFSNIFLKLHKIKKLWKI